MVEPMTQESGDEPSKNSGEKVELRRSRAAASDLSASVTREFSGSGSPEVDTYRELFERSADAILIIEGETFIDCNEATVEMLRYRDKAQLLETHPSELSPALQPDGRESHEKASEMIATAFERGSHRFEWDHVRADGEVFPVEVLLTALQEADRRILHVVWRDITNRKRLEAELRHAQKMEAVGKLAGGVAHDFNNLLVALVGNTDLLKLTVGDDPQAHKYLKQIELASDRATTLVQQLLAFSRKQEFVEQLIDVNVLISRIQALLVRLIGEDIRLETDFDSGPLRIRGDSGQIEQIMLNLVSNARDAMPDGGALTIRTRRIDVHEPAIGESRPLPPGPLVLISVSDTGFGMDAETMEHAFDPFFTTKAVGKGTGLGLATVYGVVRQAHGETSILSAENHGTTVNVYLPLSMEDVPETRVAEIEPMDRGGDETLLLVEDDPEVLALIVGALERVGYDVIPTRNGREAFDAYQARADEISLIVSDVIMPEMGGVQLVVSLCEAGHSPRVLFISGYTDNELSRLNDLADGVELLRKPFHAQDLTRRVRRALD